MFGDRPQCEREPEQWGAAQSVAVDRTFGISAARSGANAGQFGNEGGTASMVLPMEVLDASLDKSFSITEKTKIQFRRSLQRDKPCQPDPARFRHQLACFGQSLSAGSACSSVRF